MDKKIAENMAASDFLDSVHDRVQEEFSARKNLLSFDRFLELFLQNPARFTRSAYQYATDMIEHFGRRPEGSGSAERTGFALFDQGFQEGKGAVWGQAEVEEELVRLLKGFARVRRADKLILLHGPNGSSKSSLTRCLIKGLEYYSTLDEGALYRFNWIFPEERFTREKIGFTKEENQGINAQQSYAYLPDNRVAARLTCPLRDSPLFLLPKERRLALFNRLGETHPGFAVRELAEYMLEGDLSQKNRQIYDTLLTAYNGDFARVLQHVQVERYYIAERYRQGAVTIEPQMSVDAFLQQLTADRSLAALPAVLQNLNLFEPAGYLVQANHGIVEYSDLLKRPVESFKYLLGTCEKGTISMDMGLMFLDLLLVGSSNDKYLEAFKHAPDFTSFKGRMTLVRVPYLRDFAAEAKIYESQLSLASTDKALSPHLMEITALWAVLTRLRKPDPAHYPEDLRASVQRLNPLEKALYYARGDTPDWMSLQQAKELNASRQTMWREHDLDQFYEGAFGASPREGKLLLQNALQAGDEPCVAARHVFDEIRRLTSDRTVFEWLQIEPEGDYLNQEKLLSYVQDYYVQKVDDELKVAMEMIEETQYAALLERYVAQAVAWLQKKKVTDPVSGVERAADLNFLTEIERMIAPDDNPVTFRQDMVSRVGAFALDNPRGKVQYEKIFPAQLKRLERHYFSRRQTRIRKLNDNLLRSLSGRERELSDEDAAEVKGVLERMRTRFGYTAEATREVVGLLMRTRYAEGATG